MTLTANQNTSDDRAEAIDAALRWVKYQEATSPDGVILDREFIENLFDVAHQDGHLRWSGEVPVVQVGPEVDTSGLDPDIVEAVQKLQDLRNEYRSKSY